MPRKNHPMFLSILVLIIIGIILLILEILIIPGLIAGIIGSIMMLVGIWVTYKNYGSTAGNITAASTAIVTTLAVYFAFKSSAWKKFSLQQSSDAKIARADEMQINVGDVGKSISAIRPMGSAMFGNRKVEVQSNGEMIDTNTEIEVTEVLSNKLLVRKKTKNPL